MSDKTFVDTNILIYAHDLDAESKHARARMVLDELWESRNGILSTQVLQEFYVNVTRKISRPLSRRSARGVALSYAVWCTNITHAEIAAAFRIEDDYKIGFWDSLIVATAASSGATQILSEDLNAGEVIAGVRVVNPFLAAS